MIRFMTELLPIIPGPNWLKNKSQPIAIQNVMDYLLAALDNHSGHGQVFEIGGPQVTTYQELMLLYAKTRGHKRRFFLLPYVPVWFMAFGIGLTTPVPRPIAYALVGGLSSDSVVIHNAARRIYPEVNLINFESATKEALTRLHPHKIERVWDDEGRTRTLKHEGFFIYQRELKVASAPEKIFSVITKLADRFDIDYVKTDHLLLAHLKIKSPGEGWLEWRAGHAGNVTTITQTVFFTPRGFGGFFFWYLFYPIIALAFQGLLKNIVRNSVVK
jgi:hypothetical protein